MAINRNLSIFAQGTSGTGAVTLGTQQTTQGSLILANTAVGAYATTLKSSNSASAAYTITLPVSAGTSGQFLQTNGSGVTSWAAAGGGAQFSAQNTTSQNVTAATWTQVTLVEQYDTDNLFASNTFTAGTTGYHFFYGQVALETYVITGYFAMALYVDGAQANLAYVYSNAAAYADMTIPISRVLYLTAGQTVKLYAYVDGSAATKVYGASNFNTQFAGQYLHA
jgi:hypothetical protein